MLNVDHIVTGHNADDIAETVLMNSKQRSNRRDKFVHVQSVGLHNDLANLSNQPSSSWRFTETSEMHFDHHK